MKYADPPSVEFDFSKKFFEQVWELFQKCPIPHNTGTGNENCEYTDDWWYSKNCYLSHSGYKTEDLKYCYRVIEGSDSFFAIFSNYFELCIDVINSDNCFESIYLLHCKKINSSAFLYDCRNCSNCMFCFNLRNRQYCFGNQQLTQEEYERRKSQWDFLSQKTYDKAKKFFADMMLRNAWHRSYLIDKSEQTMGNYCKNTNNCQNCFFVDDEEDCVNVLRGAENANDCLDCIDNSLNGELIFMSVRSLDNCYGNKFSFDTPQSKYLEYCGYCFQCENCFGCCGLVKKKYHIFNKEYLPEEYKKLREKIIKYMKEGGSWGKFFPGYFAPNPYDESWSSFYWPLSKSEQKKLGFRVSENTEQKNDHYASPNEIPDSIEDISDEKELCEKIFWDDQYQKPFKILPADIEFSRKIKCPLPNSYYMRRIQENFSWMPFDGKLRESSCGKCSEKIQTSWWKKYDGRILCESCYLDVLK